jgi:hypothetical protein
MGCLPAIRNGLSFLGFTLDSELLVINSEGRDDLIFPEVFRDIPLADEINL